MIVVGFVLGLAGMLCFPAGGLVSVDNPTGGKMIAVLGVALVVAGLFCIGHK